jgi:hypothetical protein
MQAEQDANNQSATVQMPAEMLASIRSALGRLGEILDKVSTTPDANQKPEEQPQEPDAADAAKPEGDTPAEDDAAAQKGDETMGDAQDTKAQEALAAAELARKKAEAGLEAAKGKMIDICLTAALKDRRITSAQIEKEKSLLVTLSYDQAEIALSAINERPQMPDMTKPVGSTTPPENAAGADLKGEAKLIHLTNEMSRTKSIGFAEAFTSVCDQNPDDYDEYRNGAFKLVPTQGGGK